LEGETMIVSTETALQVLLLCALVVIIAQVCIMAWLFLQTNRYYQAWQSTLVRLRAYELESDEEID
jgi:hypothetical protein